MNFVQALALRPRKKPSERPGQRRPRRHPDRRLDAVAAHVAW